MDCRGSGARRGRGRSVRRTLRAATLRAAGVGVHRRRLAGARVRAAAPLRAPDGGSRIDVPRHRTQGGTMSELPISGSYRPTIMGTHGVVASGHYFASLAAQRILDRGGNAVDAGVAAGLCTCVLQIDMVDLAGVAPIMIYVAEQDRVVTISGLGRWPRAATVEYFRKRHDGRIPIGLERCIPPGAPDAWIKALGDFGTMSLADVMQDAITLAERGFPMHHFMAANLKEGAVQMSRWKRREDITL